MSRIRAKRPTSSIAEGQGHDRPDPWYAHQPPAHRRAPRQLLETIIQADELPFDRRQRLHERRHARCEHRIVRHRLMRRLG
jgi:uncharacterized protein (DUF2336 family)